MTTETALFFGFPSPLKTNGKAVGEERKEDINGQRKHRN
jgi:hypothetical protein